MSFLRRAPFIKRRSSSSGNLYLEAIDVQTQDPLGDGAGSWYALAGFKFKTDGTAVSVTQIDGLGAVETTLFTWLLSGSSTNFDIKITNNTGDVPTGLTLDTRYQLNVDRQVYVDASWSGSPGTGSGASTTFDIQLLDNATGTVLKSNSAILFALAGL